MTKFLCLGSSGYHGYLSAIEVVCFTLMTVAFFTEAGNDGEAGHNYQHIRVSVGDQGTIQSHGFPHQCCELQLISIYDNSTNHIRGYVHLVFDDLDLPIGTNFKIYSSREKKAKFLFKDQPSFKNGKWHRPFISSVDPLEKVIHMRLEPPSDLIHGNYTPTDYVGFKVSYQVTTEPTPYNQRTDELCPSLKNMAESQEIRMKPSPAQKYQDKWIDCVWQIKPPDGSTQQLHNEVYLIITEHELYSTGPEVLEPEGLITTDLLQVHKGVSSEAPVLDWDFHNKRKYRNHGGLYLRLFMRADRHSQRVSFQTGLAKLLKDDEPCVSGFLCKKRRSAVVTWCLPSGSRCNRIIDCPNGDDEKYCDLSTNPTSTMVVSDPKSVTTSPATTTSAAEGDCFIGKFCGGRCVILNFLCDYDWAPHCSIHQKVCPDDSCVAVYNSCKEVTNHRCLYPSDFKCEQTSKCFSSSDRCDGFYDCCAGHSYCGDVTDETGCSYQDIGDSPMYPVERSINMVFLLIIPVICGIIFGTYWLYQRQKKLELRLHGQRRQAGRDAVAAERSQNRAEIAMEIQLQPEPELIPLNRLYMSDSGQTEDPPPAYDDLSFSAISEPPPPPYETAIQHVQQLTNVSSDGGSGDHGNDVIPQANTDLPQQPPS